LSRASVMVTHAGLNSLKEALWYAVPLVALPCMLDQQGNAARIAHHGFGAVDDISRIDGEKLIARITGVLGDAGIRDRLEAMRRRFEHSERAAEGISIIEQALGGAAAGLPGPAGTTAVSSRR
jgi:zeaxanthin glucosyltransferase